ncbi:MAG: tRNA uridine-5-carboxymethylaminomethyl(34) synthesis enzyme MnmG [Alphaproteobacteria bacterium]|nr:tRNA uridine-5-carboxymethylaminomethyl(34) synthesis enzyme MnmG [Alphaproteobacteria bacterium]
MHADLVVVGGGHSGCEAAAAAARLGREVVLVTLSRAHVARLSCNPAIGGLAKGQLVRELDALGGLMGRAADASCVQLRRLNTRKGLAVQGTRAQVDIDLYPQVMQELLASLPTLTVVEEEVTDLVVEDGRVAGVRLASGTHVVTPRVVLTTGTFLAGVMHCGDARTVGGRVGDGAAHALSASLRAAGLRLGRLKTGTVPRLRADTIRWDALEAQDDEPTGGFSFADVHRRLGPLTCYLTWTHPGVHDLIRANLHRSPLFTGAIEGRGPRYCPSIEDKVVRFPDRDRHLLFLEREGHDTDRVYVNGLSTSLPADVQEAMVHAIPGLEDAAILQHGYAVEYDMADPRDLDHGLQHRQLPGLFLAGQVNGTSGYEEAAVQGFVAGVSAALGTPFRLGRDEAYIGVLVDDLVTRGVGGEPYRMFTSRAEHRLLLREDNADRRLMARGRALGLVDDATWSAFAARRDAIAQVDGLLDAPLRTDADTLARFEAAGLTPPRKALTAREVLRRPDVDWDVLRRLLPDLPPLDAAVAEQVEIDAKYAGYVTMAEKRAVAAARMDGVAVPDDADWNSVPGLSSEVRERLVAARPRTLGQLGRLPGVTPAAVGIVAAWLTAQRARVRPERSVAAR